MTGSRRRGLVWGGAVLVVALLILLVIGGFRHQVSVQRADDPQSTTPGGARALAQLLTDEGVRLTTTASVADAVADSDADTLLVVASPDRLTAAQATQIGRATYGRLLLYRPGTAGLRSFGVPAETTARAAGTVAPGCTDQAATLAGTVDADDFSAGYTSAGGAVALRCYLDPTSGGAAWLRVGGPFGSVDLVAGGVSNAVLDQEGNAAFGMNVFGSHPKIVWLMGQQAAAASGSGQGPGQRTGSQAPSLLPDWWAAAVVQGVVALIAVGIWRGRRLGPILREPLPVTVRASETVEGHGRMYARIGARDRAAEALRAGVRSRLARAYGHHTSAAGIDVRQRSDEVVALSAAIAARTGRPAPEISRLLAGPPPASDDELVTLAQNLDRLEQEARRL